MAVANFRFPAIGWLGDLSPKAKAEIAQRIPDLPVDRIAREASYYVLERDALANQPTFEEARRQLKTLSREIDALQKAIVDAAPMEWLLRQMEGMSVDAIENLDHDLSVIRKAADAAAGIVPSGRRRSLRHRLVATLVGVAPQLRNRRGDLVLLLDIIFADIGEGASDTRKIVADAFGTRRRSRPGQS